MELIKKVFATEGEIPETLDTTVGDRFQDLGSIFNFIINAIVGIGWGLVVVMLALGFLKYVMSQGEKTAVEGAQKWLTYAVIGGVGLFLISALKTIIPTLMGGSAGGTWLGFD